MYGLPCSSAVFGVLQLLLGGFGVVGSRIDFAAACLLVDHRTEILHGGAYRQNRLC